MSPQVLPLPALVLLMGPSGAGKSTWAQEHFLAGEVVSSDSLREAVGRSAYDQEASEAAFDILARIVGYRLDRGLTVVVDTLGVDADLRASMLEAAREHGMRAVLVVFDTVPELCRTRNRFRPVPVPAAALTSQIRRYREQRPAVGEEGWDLVVEVSELTAVSERADDLQRALSATPTARRTAGLAFGLVVSSFPWSPDETADRLKEVVDAAEAGGFSSLWVQDHLIQIPQVGRRWEPMLEGLAAAAWLAGISGDIAIGTLVANTSLRNPAHLAKIIATLDVLSGGRARCGLGAGWWRDEFIAYGLELPPARERLDRLEDALRLLPLMWGPGTVDFDGRTVVVKGAECYPRPIQGHVPIVVGGQGPKRTLKLAARYADGVNLRGDPDVVTRSVDVLLAHCHTVGRDPDEIEISHMSWPLVGTDRADAARHKERFRRGEAATLDEHAGRIEGLAAAGVGTFLFAPADLIDGAEAVERLVPLLKRIG